MHGATIVALHSAPDVLMVPMQQPDCGPGGARNTTVRRANVQ